VFLGSLSVLTVPFGPEAGVPGRAGTVADPRAVVVTTGLDEGVVTETVVTGVVASTVVVGSVGGTVGTVVGTGTVVVN
jgi:hypothetical protein